MSYASPSNVQLTPNPPATPGVVVWMPRPNPIPNCPPGLEYLTMVDRLLVQQIPSLLEAFTGWETNNKYVIRNVYGQQCYYAFEETDTCMRICCGAQRSFTLHIVDNSNFEVMRISREFKCCAGCCWFACADCCAHEIVVEAPVGQVVGYVKQKCSAWKASYEVLDENHNPVLKIGGPCCIFDGPCCPCDNDFELESLNGNKIGKITKEYAGFIREAFTKTDNFQINFPVDLAVKVKGTLLGALFLIDFMYFQQNNNNNNNNY